MPAKTYYDHDAVLALIRAKKAVRKLLDEIKDGIFAKKWIAANQIGRSEFNKTRASEQDYPIEKVGERLCGMMPFLDPVTIKPGQQG